MQEVIRKDFILKSGGTVTFSGDPYQANLDLQAVYTVNSASLSDLVVDPSRNQGTVKVNCLMNLTGNLSNPDIKFDLELPTVSEEDRELVRSATSTEEQNEYRLFICWELVSSTPMIMPIMTNPLMRPVL